MPKATSIFIAFTLIATIPMQASARHGDVTSKETQIQQVITTLEEETRRLADVCVLTSVGELKTGKNRLRILINGELQDRTITYVR